jgi:NADPH2:quinone reductase
MKAAWYEHQGPASEVLVIGEMPDPTPSAGEVRIRLAASGINPADLKKRENAFGVGMLFPRIIPHSDGAGVIDQVGEGVPQQRVGQRVWCFGAQSCRPFGTAAEYTIVPAQQAIALPAATEFEVGASLGIPALTAHRAVHAGGALEGKSVLIQGGAGAVGSLAVGLSRHAGATIVAATVRSPTDEDAARRAGAHHVLRTDGADATAVVDELRRVAPGGFHHVVEVAFDANIDVDMMVLANEGSIAAYATNNPRPSMPFWDLLFKNARVLLLNSEDFSLDQKQAAAVDVNGLLTSGWQGIHMDRTFPLQEIAAAHDHVAGKRGAGRVVLVL